MPKEVQKNYRIVVVSHRQRQLIPFVERLTERQITEEALEDLKRAFKEHKSLSHLEAYMVFDTEDVCALCERPYELFEGACAWCGEKEPE